jgi:hypothetical protein
MKWTLAVVLAVMVAAIALSAAPNNSEGLVGRVVDLYTTDIGGLTDTVNGQSVAHPSGGRVSSRGVTIKAHGPMFVWFVYPGGTEVYHSGSYVIVARK